MRNFRKLIDNLGRIICNNERAFKLSWLIGEGLNFNLYTKWMDNYNSANIRLRYFQGATPVAIADMAACTFYSPSITLCTQLSSLPATPTVNVDFGGISTPLSEAQQAAQPDVVSLPIIAYAAGPSYNVWASLPPPPLSSPSWPTR